MDEYTALAKMIAPGTRRPGKYREGVIQIWLTRSCDKSCFNCTQGSNYGGKAEHMTPEQFGQAVESLRGYFGVVGVFGGNPCMSPHFVECCRILRESWVPKRQCGLWSNNLLTPEKGEAARSTFSPAVSNLNVHLDHAAYDTFKVWWPESQPFGRDKDSRHSPVYVAMRDVLNKKCEKCAGTGFFIDPPFDVQLGEALEGKRQWATKIPCPYCQSSGTVYDEAKAWELISDCDINKHWSAMIGVFRGQLRAWFCEIAGAQAMLHQSEPDYPDTGRDPTRSYGIEPVIVNEKSLRTLVSYADSTVAPLRWWQLPMQDFSLQVRKHCHDCGVPLRGHGELAQANDRDGVEHASAIHASVAVAKRKGRRIELLTTVSQLGEPLGTMTKYLQNADK